MEKPLGRRPIGRPRRRWDDNTNTDFKERSYENRDELNWFRIVFNGDL
jgi:hypothetical protein